LGHGAVYHRQVDASLLEDLSIDQHATDTAAAVLTHPRVLFEYTAAIEFLDGLADVILGVAAHGLELSPHTLVALDLVDQGFRDGVDGLVIFPSDDTLLLFPLMVRDGMGGGRRKGEKKASIGIGVSARRRVLSLNNSMV
jgi:hypothetical protein